MTDQDPLPPLTPKFRATARMSAAHDCGWDEATDLMEHTFEGQATRLNEQARELGRVIAREFPLLTRLILHYPPVAVIRWILRRTR